LTQECLLGSLVMTQKGIQECLLGSIVLTQKGIPGSILLIQDCMHTNSVCMHVVAKTKQKRQRPGRAARTRERCPPLAGRAPRRSPQRGGHTRVPGDSFRGGYPFVFLCFLFRTRTELKAAPSPRSLLPG